MADPTVREIVRFAEIAEVKDLRISACPVGDGVSARPVTADFLAGRLQPLARPQVPAAPRRPLTSYLASTIDARAVDKIYRDLRDGQRGQRTRTANLCILRAARAWDVVQRLYPRDVPAENPFRGVELTYGNSERPAATREQAIALHKALVAAGELHLAVAPLVCLEWMQRPETSLPAISHGRTTGQQNGQTTSASNTTRRA